MVVLDGDYEQYANYGHPVFRISHSQDDEEEINPHSSTGQNTDSNVEDNPEILFKMFTQVSTKLWQQLKRVFEFAVNGLGGGQFFDRMAQWCVRHPIIAVCLLAGCLVAFLPALLFLAFVFSTIFVAFTGFLVLEGTLLTFLTMILFGLFGAFSVVFLLFALVGVATYFGVSRVYDMYGSTEVQRTFLRNFMRRN